MFHSCGNQLAITHPMSAVRFFEEGPDGEFRPSENFAIGEPTVQASRRLGVRGSSARLDLKQFVQLTGTGSLHPLAIEAAVEATKLSIQPL